jgi:CRISPR-associated protein Csy1
VSDLARIDALIAAGHARQAVEDARAVLRRAPDDLDARFYLAKSLLAAGLLDECAAELEWLDAKGAGAFAAFAALRAAWALQRNDHAAAVEALRRATALDPLDADAWSRLAHALAASGDGRGALSAWRRHCEIDNSFEAWMHLGDRANVLGDTALAIEAFGRACGREPRSASAWRARAAVAAEAFDFATAAEALRRLLEIEPADEPARQLLGAVLAEMGRDEEARAALSFAGGAPASSARRLRAALMLPQIAASRDHLRAARRAFAEGLANLEQDATWCAAPGEAIRLAHSNFLLAYQGEDDRQLQTRYAELLRSRLARDHAALVAPLERRPAGRRIRVGFLSSFFRQCTIGNYFAPWVLELDAARFERVVFSTGWAPDALGERLRAAADEFHLLRGSALSVAEAVRAARLDALIYPEVGMGAQNYLLVNLRLAPLQCAAWGHPVTTGSAQIDLFLTCEGMEPHDGASHYAESIALLPGIGTCYAMPAGTRAIRRASLGLGEGDHVYVCPQSLFKIHPDNDEIFVELVSRDPRAVVLFFQAAYPALNEAFQRRLVARLAACGVDARRQFKFLPRTDEEGFRGVLAMADVMLDTLHWSGGNSSLDALAAGAPIVSLPGRFMRGRQTMAMLRALDCTASLVSDRSAYVETAIGIACDRALNADLRARLRENRGALFDRHEPIRALECLLEARIRGAQ